MQYEDETLEYKESLAESETAGKDICAFANKNGGNLYFGIKNNGTIKGLNGPITEKTIRDLVQLYYDNIKPSLVFSIDKIKMENRDIIEIKIIHHRLCQKLLYQIYLKWLY